MMTGFLLLAIFGVMAVLMFRRKLPVLLALPLMAIAIAAVGGIPLSSILSDVIGNGALRLAEAATITMFGGMLSFFLQKTGVAESLIKMGAELAGDDPWKVGLIMLILIITLFTTLGGLGAIIMVATVVLPIMASVGMTPMIAGGLFLIGLSAGGILNAGNWAVYIGVMHLDVPTVRNYALLLFAAAFVMALVFMTVELWRARQIRSLRKYFIRAGVGVASAAALTLVARQLPAEQVDAIGSQALAVIGTGLEYILLAIGAAAAIHIVSDLVRKRKAPQSVRPVQWYAYLIPILPLILILVYQVNFISAFLIAVVYGYIVTLRKGSLNLLTQAVIEGSASVIPAVLLMFGIGMLLNAIIGPSGYAQLHGGAEWPVIGYLRPLIASTIPTTWVWYLAAFTIAAPLALYRGPLNVWGLGYGLAAVMMATGKISGAAIMAMLLSVGQVQGVCDPTNTQNVWLANELKLDVQAILWRTLPYMWGLAFIGLLVGVVLFY
ncbi:MAG: citrate transporter [Acidobacteriota bacterium]